jgi:hypothetical protein
VVDIAMGDVKVSEVWEDGSPKRYEHKLKLDALTLLAKMRGLVVDNVAIRGIGESEAEVDRLLKAELSRVRGVLPGSADVVDAVAVTSTPVDDVAPSTDAAGEPPNSPDVVD